MLFNKNLAATKDEYIHSKHTYVYLYVGTVNRTFNGNPIKNTFHKILCKFS